MHEEIERAILHTLIYSDIFDYPLSKDELWRFLIGRVDRASFEEVLTEFPLAKWEHKSGLYFLSGREGTVGKRIKRKETSRKKLEIAKKIIERFSFLPTIQFIGISGALSLGNATKEDDIDLFVIASKNRLWLTRLSIIIFLLLIGSYRKRNDQEVSDKICLNMLIDESALSFSKARQNLYTAHEVVQMIPAFDRNDMYKKFMSKNKWISKFLPNSLDTKILGYKDIKRKEVRSLSIPISKYLNIFLIFFENLAKHIQLWSIKKHVTTETVKDNFLGFHPLDYKEKVLSEYKRKLREYEI